MGVNAILSGYTGLLFRRPHCCRIHHPTSGGGTVVTHCVTHLPNSNYKIFV